MSTKPAAAPYTSKTVGGKVYRLTLVTRTSNPRLQWFCPKYIETLELTAAESEALKMVGITIWEPTPNPQPRYADQRWLEAQPQYAESVARDCGLANWYSKHKV